MHLVSAAILLAALAIVGCGTMQPRPLTQPESQTVIAHYNNGNPALAVPESTLIKAFEREIGGGVSISSVWIESRGGQYWLIARGMNEGRAISRQVEIIRDAAIPENMYVSLKGSVKGQIGGWR